MKYDSLAIHTLNLGIRGVSIALKFLLTIYIGKYYPEESLGGYGLFCTAIASSFCIIGFGFDGYASREIVSRSKPEKFSYIKSTFNFYILSWAIVTPFIFVFTRTSSINFEGFLYYYSILLFETCANVFVVIFNILNKYSIICFISVKFPGVIASARDSFSCIF